MDRVTCKMGGVSNMMGGVDHTMRWVNHMDAVSAFHGPYERVVDTNK